MMVLDLFHIIAKTFHFTLPAAFSYFSTRMILACLTSLLFTIGFGKQCITFLYNIKTGQSIRVEDCPVLAKLHEKKKQTPSMGGLLILLSIFLSMLLWMNPRNGFTLLLIFSLVGFGALGACDDYLKMKYKNSKGLKSSLKFFVQLLLALSLAIYLYVPEVSYGLQKKIHVEAPQARAPDSKEVLPLQIYQGQYYFPFFKHPICSLSGWALFLGFVFTLFVITGTSNAVNFTDGLDGLASGLILMLAGTMALVAFLSNHLECARYLHLLYIEGSGEIAIFLAAMFGACLGFLWYNGHPAQVFMGDVGSLSLGALLGLCAVLLRKEFLLALVGGVFVIEALSVILQILSFKYRKGKRIFLCAPLHHHFEYKGWPESKVVVRFWIVGLILACIGLASIKFQ